VTTLARRVLYAALAAEALLMALHIPARIADGAKIFRVDEESNLPTWFSSSQFLLAALACALLAAGDRARRFGWGVLAAIMLEFSVDEVAELHERVEDRAGFDTALLLLEPLIGLVALVVIWRALSSLPRMPARLLLFALFCAVAAQASSVVTGKLEPPQGVEYTFQALEELFEMLAGTFILVAALEAGSATWARLVPAARDT
jgi:hypothetical protein